MKPRNRHITPGFERMKCMNYVWMRSGRQRYTLIILRYPHRTSYRVLVLGTYLFRTLFDNVT